MMSFSTVSFTYAGTIKFANPDHSSIFGVNTRKLLKPYVNVIVARSITNRPAIARKPKWNR